VTPRKVGIRMPRRAMTNRSIGYANGPEASSNHSYYSVPRPHAMAAVFECYDAFA
jgi:hypothetical protein